MQSVFSTLFRWHTALMVLYCSLQATKCTFLPEQQGISQTRQNISRSLMDRERMRCWKWPVIIMKSDTVTIHCKVGHVDSSKCTWVSLNASFRTGWPCSAVRGSCQQLSDVPRCFHYLCVAFISMCTHGKPERCVQECTQELSWFDMKSFFV